MLRAEEKFKENDKSKVYLKYCRKRYVFRCHAIPYMVMVSVSKGAGLILLCKPKLRKSCSSQ